MAATIFSQTVPTVGSQLTITLTALANGSYRQSDEVLNDTAGTQYLDAMLVVRVATSSPGVTSAGTLEIYGFGQVVDAANIRTDTMGSADAASSKPNNARLIAVMQCNSNNAVYAGGPYSVANAFGGVLPPRWGIVIGNQTGVQLTNSASFHVAYFAGYKEQGV